MLVMDGHLSIGQKSARAIEEELYDSSLVPKDYPLDSVPAMSEAEFVGMMSSQSVGLSTFVISVAGCSRNSVRALCQPWF